MIFKALCKIVNCKWSNAIKEPHILQLLNQTDSPIYYALILIMESDLHFYKDSAQMGNLNNLHGVGITQQKR